MISLTNFDALQQLQAKCLHGDDPFEGLSIHPRKDGRGFSVFTEDGARFATFVFPKDADVQEEQRQ